MREGMSETTAQVVGKKNSLVRDAVTIGIFLALYIVLFMLCGFTMGAVPLIMILLPLIFGVFGGVIFMVLLSKVQRTGIFLITGLVIGAFMINMAPAAIMCWMTILGGIVGEVAYNLLGKKTFKGMLVGYTLFIMLFALGEYIPFIWMRDAYLRLYEGMPTISVLEAGLEMMNPMVMVLLLAGTVICCVIGCLWGRAMTKKQFSRAGIV